MFVQKYFFTLKDIILIFKSFRGMNRLAITNMLIPLYERLPIFILFNKVFNVRSPVENHVMPKVPLTCLYAQLNTYGSNLDGNES